MTKAPKKNGMTVNGRRTMLEVFFLEMIDRPLPKAPTHYLVTEVLNTDLSVKRVTTYFNPADTWQGNYNFHPNTPQSVGMAINDGLVFLNKDPNTLAYKSWVVEVATNTIVHQFCMAILTKAEL